MNYHSGAGLEAAPGTNPSSALLVEGQDRLLGPQPHYPGSVGMRDPNGALAYGANPSGSVGDANLLGGDELVAARLRAAAVAARRDYQYATMQLRQIEAAEKQK